MDLKDIRLTKGMTKDEANELIKDYILLEDEVYLGNNYNHNWKCLKCNEGIIENRKWSNIRLRGSIKCVKCKYREVEDKNKKEVEKDGEYEYIKTFFKGDTLPNKKVVDDKATYLQVRHKYCGNIYEVQVGQFIKVGQRCGKCCQKYENSFAYHIERELGLKLEDVWDFEKNTVNPYHIHKNYIQNKIWIKCQEKDYHSSYEVSCNKFVTGRRCPYCLNKKVHPKDSFGAKHPDKAQCWHEDNDKSPYDVSPSSNLYNAKFRCGECGHVWVSKLNNIDNGRWCPGCANSRGEAKIKRYLSNSYIEYIHDKEYFKDLIGIGGGLLRPDFILPNEKIWIEYDGEFHYRDVWKDGSYEILKEHDKRKDGYAKQHGWKLIRISYWEIDNIENILNIELKSVCR